LQAIGQNTGSYSVDFANNDGVASGEHFVANFGRGISGGINSVLIGYRGDGSNVSGGFIRAGDSDPFYLGTSSNTQTVTITDSGSVGIGTTSPLATFHVSDSQTATASAYITNTNTAAGITGLAIKLSSTTLDTTSRFINFLDKNGTRIGKINAANTTTVAYSANGTDMAEYFSKDGSNPQVGDIVSYSNNAATKTTVAYDPQLLGIVSDSAGFVGGEEGPNKVLVALVGQVPVKINPNSPAISKGDFITSSLVAGLGTKATHAGFVVGKALEDWTPGGPSTIKVYINNIWADPNNQLAFDETGNLAIAGQVTAQDFKVNSLVDSINTSLNLINDQFASVSAEIADLKFQVANASGSANVDNLWSYATESGKLSTIYNVQTGSLDVIGKLKVGLLAFDDLDASIESLTGIITAKGDLAVEGKVTASKYNVDTTNVLGASLGKAVIPAGQTELVITTSAASTTSAIFVTPEIYAIPVATEATQAGQFVARLLPRR
jgi:hypothetical protein